MLKLENLGKVLAHGLYQKFKQFAFHSAYLGDEMIFRLRLDNS